MAITLMPVDGPTFTSQAFRVALSALAGVAPSGRPVGATSGVRPGTPTTTVTMSGGGSTTWNVGAHSGVLDTETSANAGPYYYATDGTDTGSITAADPTNPRIDIIYIQVDDNVQDGSTFEKGVVGYLAGAPAASPAAPATPARGMALATIAVPPAGGGTPSATWVAPTFGAAPWISYSPGYTGIGLGNGAITGRYSQVGKTVTAVVTFAAGSTTTYSSAFIIALPVAPQNTAASVAIGTAFGDNGTTGSRQTAAVILNGGATVYILGPTANSVWSSTVPFTWGTTAHLTFTVTYEAA